MKSTIQSSISPGRHTLWAATLALLASAAFVSAQTTGAAGSTSAGSSQKNPSSSYGSSSDTSRSSSDKSTTDTSATSSTGSSSYDSGSSTYKSGTGSSDINATSSTSSTGAGAMTGRSTTSDKLSWGDRRFVTKAADDGNDEIALAKLAADKASNAEVKSFAQKLVDDHQMVASELQTIASQKNVKIDKDNDHDRAYKRLSKKTGSDFDQEFVAHMIDEHEKNIKMFEKAAKDAKDPDVRSFASKHVDHLREHLKMAENLRQTIMPTGRADTNSSRGTTRSSTSSYDIDSSSSTPSSTSSSSSSSDTSKDKDKSSSSSSSTDTSRSSTTPPPDNR